MVKKTTKAKEVTDDDMVSMSGNHHDLLRGGSESFVDEVQHEFIDGQEDPFPVKKKRGKVSKKVAKKRGKAIADATKALKNDPNALTPLEERFCQLYATEEFFCNGVKSYMQASLDMGKKVGYDVACSLASRLLRKVKIQKRNEQLITEISLNDQFVDKQLGKVITQDVHFPSKVSAIKEYNTLKKRTAQTIVHQFSDLQTMSDAELAKEEQKLISFFTKK